MPSSKNIGQYSGIKGKRIVVTRAPEQSDSLVKLLEDLGAVPLEVPVISFHPPDDGKPLDEAIQNLIIYNWIVFTSANAVKWFFDRKNKVGLLEWPTDLKIAAIGRKTADAIEAQGVRADLVPEQASASEELLEAMTKTVPLAQVKILFPRAQEARDLLPEGLKAEGATVHMVSAYKTVPSKEGKEKIDQLLKGPTADWITFTSGSSVRSFFDVGGVHAVRTWIEKTGVDIAVIGRVTEGVLLEYELESTVTAAEQTVESMAEAIADFEEE